MKLVEAFQDALESAKNDAEKAEIIAMLEETERRLSTNEDDGEKIASELSVLLNGTEKKMQKIKRSHREDKSETKDKGSMSKILDDIENNS